MKLKDCLETIIDNRGKNPKYYVKEAYPVIDNVMIKNNYHPNLKEATRFIDQETHDIFLRGYLEPDLPIMTLVGSGIGNVSLSIDDKSVIVQNTIGFKTKPEILNSIYLYYWFLYKHEELIQFNRGSGQPSIRKTDIENMNIDFKNINYQKKVSKILSNIDKKIELNNEINNNLYDEMQFLYNEWFKEFNPFKNNQFKDTVLGKIPEKFTIEDIYSISSVIYGAPFKSNLFNEEKNGKPIIRIRDLKNQDMKTYTPENHPKGYLLQKGDITVGMDGEFRPYFWGNDEAWLNQRVCVFDNKRKKGKAFLYYTLKPLLSFIEKTEVATTVIHIGKNDFDEFKIILPDEDTLDKFDEITNPMVWQIVQNMIQNHRLENLRDTLLPKLMNGGIDLDNIEI